MIPEQTITQFPVWGANATKVEPNAAKYSAGWQEADVIPHEWLNWLLNRASQAVTKHNAGVQSMEKEIISVLTASGQTPDSSEDGQLLDAINYLIQQGGNAVEAITASTVKSPIKDSRYVITVANVSLTLTNDSGANHNLATATVLFLAAGSVIYHDTSGTQVTESHAAGEIVSLRRAGQYWIPSVRNVNGNLKINL